MYLRWVEMFGHVGSEVFSNVAESWFHAAFAIGCAVVIEVVFESFICALNRYIT
jgi:hypothetical protein